MSRRPSHSRRTFLQVGAAAGASLLGWPDAVASGTAQPPGLPAPGTEWAVRGKLLQAPAPDQLESRLDALVIIGPDGVITHVQDADPAHVDPFRRTGRLLELTPTQYLLPGLIDTHVHAPQWPQAGTALDLPLEQWLFEYTFKLEARYSDLVFAREVYDARLAAIGLVVIGVALALLVRAERRRDAGSLGGPGSPI